MQSLRSLCVPLWAQVSSTGLGRHSTLFIWKPPGLPSGWKGLQTLLDNPSTTILTDLEPQRSTEPDGDWWSSLFLSNTE